MKTFVYKIIIVEFLKYEGRKDTQVGKQILNQDSKSTDLAEVEGNWLFATLNLKGPLPGKCKEL